MKNSEIMKDVAEQVLALMEEHGTGWVKPWAGQSGGFPVNATTGKAYRGINIVLLFSRGFASPEWATFKQWKTNGASVMKGQRGTKIVFWKPIEVKDESKDDPDAKKKIWMLKTYTVFNADQVEGYETPTVEPVAPIGDAIECPELESYLANAKIKIQHGGDSAYYRPSTDHIQMPEKPAFKGTDTSTPREAYYSTLAHEATHWTGHKSRLDRLDRLTNGKFGDKNYAFEELVAELGAVFLTMQFGVSPAPRPDHAQYLNSWMKALRDTPRTILAAASEAQKAVDLLDAAQPVETAQAA